MKTCFKCSRTLPISEFYRHPETADGHLNKCKDCTKRDVSERYAAKHAEIAAYEHGRAQTSERRRKRQEYAKRHKANHPDRAAARTALHNALRDGRIVRGPCEACGATSRVQAHHDDYSKPIDVRWLCFRCHREVAHHQRTAA